MLDKSPQVTSCLYTLFLIWVARHQKQRLDGILMYPHRRSNLPSNSFTFPGHRVSTGRSLMICANARAWSCESLMPLAQMSCCNEAAMWTFTVSNCAKGAVLKSNHIMAMKLGHDCKFEPFQTVSTPSVNIEWQTMNVTKQWTSLNNAKRRMDAMTLRVSHDSWSYQGWNFQKQIAYPDPPPGAANVLVQDIEDLACRRRGTFHEGLFL